MIVVCIVAAQNRKKISARIILDLPRFIPGGRATASLSSMSMETKTKSVDVALKKQKRKISQ